MTATNLPDRIETVVVDRDTHGRMVFESEHARLVADQLAPGVSVAEIQTFLMLARDLDLNPFTGQIWLIQRYNSQLRRKAYRPEVGIAGFRAVAERSGLYGGTRPSQWLDDRGKWVDVWTADSPPTAARVTVVRKDWPEPHVETLTWNEAAVYNKIDGKMVLGPLWQQRPSKQLEKCCEAAALRRCFSNLGGVYIPGELADDDDGTVEQIVAERVGPDEAVKAVFDEFMPLAARIVDVDAFKATVVEQCAELGLGEPSEFKATAMTEPQARVMIKVARSLVDDQADDDDDEGEDDPCAVAAASLPMPVLKDYAASVGMDPLVVKRIPNRAALLAALTETSPLTDNPVELADHIREWAQL